MMCKNYVGPVWKISISSCNKALSKHTRESRLITIEWRVLQHCLQNILKPVFSHIDSNLGYVIDAFMS